MLFPYKKKSKLIVVKVPTSIIGTTLLSYNGIYLHN
jgi:hypothetical protein